MRQRITFEDVNRGKIRIIPAKDIAESKARIKKEMTPIVRDYERKSLRSWMEAKIKIINT